MSFQDLFSNVPKSYHIYPDQVTLTLPQTTAQPNDLVTYQFGLAQFGGGSSGIHSINSDISTAQILNTGTNGTDFNIVDNLTGTHTFNLPPASTSTNGKLLSTDWNTFNNKMNTITGGVTGDLITINGSQVQDSGKTITTVVNSSSTSSQIPTASAVYSSLSTVSPVWGNITGTITAQTDLQTEFGTKLNTISAGTTGDIVIVNGSQVQDSGKTITTVVNSSSTSNQIPNALAVFNAISAGGSYIPGTSSVYLSQINNAGSGAVIDFAMNSHSINGVGTLACQTLTNSSTGTLNNITMNTALNMASHQINSVANGTGTNDAVNVSQIANFVPYTGATQNINLNGYNATNMNNISCNNITTTGTSSMSNITMTAPLNMNTHQINGVSNGTNSTDAVNLSQLSGYVANPLIADINFNGHSATGVGNVTSSTGTFSGIGTMSCQTLTNSSTATLTGVTMNSALNMNSYAINNCSNILTNPLSSALNCNTHQINNVTSAGTITNTNTNAVNGTDLYNFVTSSYSNIYLGYLPVVTIVSNSLVVTLQNSSGVISSSNPLNIFVLNPSTSNYTKYAITTINPITIAPGSVNIYPMGNCGNYLGAYNYDSSNIYAYLSIISSTTADICLSYSGNIMPNTAVTQYSNTNTSTYQQKGKIYSATSTGTYPLLLFGKIIGASCNTSTWAAPSSSIPIYDPENTSPWYSLGQVVPSTQLSSTFLAQTTNPTVPTVTNSYIKWRRVGSNAEFMIWCNLYSVAGTGAGSGTYSIQLPPGFYVDLNVLATNGYADSFTGSTIQIYNSYLNNYGSYGGNVNFGWVCTQTSICLSAQSRAGTGGGVTDNYISNSFYPINNAFVMCLNFSVPISGWT